MPQPESTPKPSRRRKLVRVFPTTPGYVPTRVLGPIIVDLMVERRFDNGCLSAASGIPERTLYALREQRRQAVEFRVADALLTAMDAMHLWHEEPLLHFLEPPDPAVALINPSTDRQLRAARAMGERKRKDPA